MHIVLCALCIVVCVVLLRTGCLGKSSTSELPLLPYLMSLKRGHKLVEEELLQRFVGAETETQNLCNSLELRSVWTPITLLFFLFNLDHKVQLLCQARWPDPVS